MITAEAAEVTTTADVEVRAAMTRADIPAATADAGGAAGTTVEEARDAAALIKRDLARTAAGDAAMGRTMARKPRRRRETACGSSIKHAPAPAERTIAWK